MVKLRVAYPVDGFVVVEIKLGGRVVERKKADRTHRQSHDRGSNAQQDRFP